VDVAKGDSVVSWTGIDSRYGGVLHIVEDGLVGYGRKEEWGGEEEDALCLENAQTSKTPVDWRVKGVAIQGVTPRLKEALHTSDAQ
jgi:hypothetical protein